MHVGDDCAMVLAVGSFESAMTVPWMVVCVNAPLGAEVPASAPMLPNGSDEAVSAGHPLSPSTAHDPLPVGTLSRRP